MYHAPLPLCLWCVLEGTTRVTTPSLLIAVGRLSVYYEPVTSVTGESGVLQPFRKHAFHEIMSSQRWQRLPLMCITPARDAIGCSRSCDFLVLLFMSSVEDAKREGRRPRDGLATASAGRLLPLLQFWCLFPSESPLLNSSMPISADLMFCFLFLLLLKLLFAFTSLPHKSPSLTSSLPMLQAISDHSISIPEIPIAPLSR